MPSKQGIREIEPMKAKSAPDHHWCYVCKQWFYMPKEDFPAFGHYSKSDYQDHLVRLNYEGKRLKDALIAAMPDKPKPVLVRV